MKLNKILSPIAGIILMVAHGGVCAVDSVSIETGVGQKVQMARLGAQWDWGSRWFKSRESHVGGYWDLTVAQWRGTKYRNTQGERQNITNIGITPVFRFQKDDNKGLYAEAGVGLNLLSKLYDNNDTHLSTRFQFGDHVGIGYVFQNKLDLSLRFQHFSNAKIKTPNDGVEFLTIRARYIF
jgi:lipid A 3-O-deacylase